ncbi:MAG: HAD family hydrolase [Muribaculaceae bacterium]|nr:HAD family hydrolase [Muribaculaceae bacterium]
MKFDQDIKGIIFDYGGTLDSRGDHWSEVIWNGYRAAGVDVDKELFRDAYVHAERALAKHPYIRPDHNFLDLLRIKMLIELEWLADRGAIEPELVKLKAEAVARYCYSFARSCVEEARPVLEALAERFPLVLVSNFYGNIASVLADFSLDKFFPQIIESAVVGVRKPDPEIFRLGVRALGLEPEQVLVVGDSLKKDILPAESIGCRVAWLKGKGWTPEEDAAVHPSVISSLSDLLPLLGI